MIDRPPKCAAGTLRLRSIRPSVASQSLTHGTGYRYRERDRYRHRYRHRYRDRYCTVPSTPSGACACATLLSRGWSRARALPPGGGGGSVRVRPRHPLPGSIDRINQASVSTHARGSGGHMRCRCESAAVQPRCSPAAISQAPTFERDGHLLCSSAHLRLQNAANSIGVHAGRMKKGRRPREGKKGGHPQSSRLHQAFLCTQSSTPAFPRYLMKE